jgi:hypothetical protein
LLTASCAAVLQAATQAEVDNVITFNDAGEGVSITKLSPKAVKANTVNTKCAANDQFTGIYAGCLTLCTHAGITLLLLLLLLLHAYMVAIESMLCT